MPESPQLHVIIVGAGLAGLTAALILAPHHRVTVYERGGPDVATGGQGIIVAPNGVKILQGIGFEPARAGAVPIRGIRTYGRDGVLLEDVDMDLKQRFGADSWAIKRGDFRGVLGQMVAEAAKGEGMVEIVYGSGVVGVECDRGVVELEGGEKVKGDVVIVADGVHSRLRNTILKSNEYKAKKTGLTCYRIAVSTEDASVALGDLPPPHWWDPSNSQNNSALIFADDGSPRFITAYPIRNAEMFNLSCILRTDESTKTTAESWHADGDRNEMIETFSDFGEQVKRILSAATEVKVWELQDLEPLPTWTSGRVMLIGDAAHAMSPLQGQGANMSIEDAESLRLLTPDTRPEDVLELLKLAESVRRPRTAQVLAQTRASHSKFATVGERLTANLDFNCGYDGIHDALARQKAAAK